MRLKETLLAGVVLAATFAASSASALTVPLGTLPTENLSATGPYSTNPSPGGTVFAPNTFTFTEGSPLLAEYALTLSSTISIPSGNTLDLSGGNAMLELFSGTPGSGTLLFSADYSRMGYVSPSKPGAWAALIDPVDLAPGSYYFTTVETSAISGKSAGRSLSFGYSLTNTSGVPEASTWAMMIIGMAGLGFVGYRRRAVAAV